MIGTTSFRLIYTTYLHVYIFAYIHTYLHIFKFAYIYIYIYTNLPVNAIVRLPHPQNGDSQGQETFLAPPADKQTRNYDTIYIFIYVCIQEHFFNNSTIKG